MPHPIRLGMTVGRPTRPHRRRHWAVAVFDPTRRFFRRAVARVHANHRLATHGPAKGNEFISAEIMRFHSAPGVIGPGWPLLQRSHAILPMITTHEIATRP